MTASSAGEVGWPADISLLDIHKRLAEHFAGLRAIRDKHAPDIPIFALEHGLTDSAITVLRERVHASVRAGILPRESWLPFVVYATEVGYKYSGDEYWQTFESQTPRWAENGDRDYIREKFRQFCKTFGGAEPSGAWAEHFTIICWPITHAVLPTDFQRQLARLLFEYRRALTSDLLDHPAELGRQLAARAWQASSRFQNFAQNTDLLGQVSVALLLGDSDDSAYLLHSTLMRIVEDLSKEAEAKVWLRDAKSTAIRVRTRGLGTSTRPPSQTGGTTRRQTRLPSAMDPDLSLREEAGGWTAYLEFPDLSALAERLPNVQSELGRLRARIAGAQGPPLARGRLLYPGQKVRLGQWPEAGSAIVTLEDGSQAVNNLLSQQCVLSSEPPWLFRVRDPHFATEVRGTFVRPSHEYVLLTRKPFSIELPPWIVMTACGTVGVHSYGITVPSILEPDDLAALRLVSIGAITDVDVRPAGLVPAVWDGEGTAEWITGDAPVIRVSASRRTAHCVFTLNGEPHLVKWPSEDGEIFVRLGDLEVGSHDLQVSLVPSDADQPNANGSLAVVIRPPQHRPASGSLREGLMIAATPVSPSLTELWNGSAALSVLGPLAAEATLELSLADQANKILARHQLPIVLPFSDDEWRSSFSDGFRQMPEIYDRYDEAEALLIAVSSPQLGSVSLRADREFSVFRWAAGRDGEGPFVRLINNAEGKPPEVEFFAFARPDHGVPLDIGVEPRIHRSDGGLVRTKANATHTAVILPPKVKDWGDLQRLNVAPRLSVTTRSLSGICKLVGLADLWATASLPANPFGENRRDAVLRAIAATLGGVIGGEHWERMELSIAAGDGGFEPARLQSAVGDKPFYQSLARDLARHVSQFRRLPPEKRAAPFAVALAAHSHNSWMHAGNSRLAEFLLRLASDPASLARWPADELKADVQRVLDLPVLARAARFLVLMTQQDESGTSSSRRGVWRWQ